MNEEIRAAFRAGFIAACKWPEPVSQDVDSPAFDKEIERFVEKHTHLFQDGFTRVPLKANHAQMMAGYEAANRYGVYESKAFDMAELIYTQMIALA